PTNSDTSISGGGGREFRRPALAAAFTPHHSAEHENGCRKPRTNGPRRSRNINPRNLTMQFSRRSMLQSVSCGFGYLALQALVGKPALAATTSAPAASSGLAAKAPALAPRAKRVIFLCMSGGPAQLDTFDYKP